MITVGMNVYSVPVIDLVGQQLYNIKLLLVINVVVKYIRFKDLRLEDKDKDLWSEDKDL